VSWPVGGLPNLKHGNAGKQQHIIIVVIIWRKRRRCGCGRYVRSGNLASSVQPASVIQQR